MHCEPHLETTPYLRAGVISAYRYPDLRRHRVFGGAQKRLDSQMLLDPFEEQLHLPRLAVKRGNQFGLESKIVGQERHSLAGVVLDHDPAQDKG